MHQDVYYSVIYHDQEKETASLSPCRRTAKDMLVTPEDETAGSHRKAVTTVFMTLEHGNAR